MPVSGTITDENGDPVSGANVYVIDNADNSIMGAAETDGNGDYSVSTDRDTEVHVFATWTDANGDPHTVFSKGWVDVTPDEEPTWIENFNDEDLSGYTGDTGAFGTVQSPTFEGAAALVGNGWSSTITGTPTTPIEKPAEFEFYWRPSVVDASYNQTSFYWGADGDNAFSVGMNWNTGDKWFSVKSWSGGSEQSSQGAAPDWDPAEDVWYRVHVTWDDGSTYGGEDNEITATMESPQTDDEVTVSNTPAEEYAGDAISFYIDRSDDFYWDAVRLLSEVSTGMHADFTASDAEGTTSSTVALGNSFLAWVKPTQLGSSGHQIHPGLSSGEVGGSWNQWCSLESADGNTYTSGTRTAQMRVDNNSTQAISDTFEMTLDEWNVVGWTISSNPTFFHNDSVVGTTQGSFDAGHDLMSIGAGYASATNSGMGDKYLDGVIVTSDELTQSEVADYYNNYTLPDNLKHFWAFDDDSDTSTAVDEVGGADATLTSISYVEGNASAP